MALSACDDRPRRPVPEDAGVDASSEASSAPSSSAPSSVSAVTNVDWLTFRNADAGLRLQYPPEVTLLTRPADEPEGLGLFITIDPIAGAENSADLEADRTALAAGEYGIHEDAPVEGSEQVAPVDGGRAKVFTVMSRTEICDVSFDRGAVLYAGDYRVRLLLRASEKKMLEAAPKSFRADPGNCGQKLVWKAGRPKRFYAELARGKGPAFAVDWFRTFDEILATVTVR